MPWKETTPMSQRKAFIKAAIQPDCNMTQLCLAYEISRKTGYKWLGRYRQDGEAGLRDRSRRPKHSPEQTPPEVEAEVLALRRKHPAWGGRKLHVRLKALGHAHVPSPSTITRILQRHGCIDPAESEKRQHPQRFEKEHPNQMWQMDFKGPFEIGMQSCHPLTILDDHSRYLLGLFGCKNQRRGTVKAHLTSTFQAYGLPECMLVDNGPPWGWTDGRYYTKLAAWLIRLGITVSHSSPYHPQTLGKDERLHRSLKAEILKTQSFADFEGCQSAFDTWREVYNQQRPHEALEMETPSTRYQPSVRPFPESLPPIEYADCIAVRKVCSRGTISFQGQRYKIGKAFSGYPVGLYPALADRELEVHFCHQQVKLIPLK
ncbi:MAG: IS481 family transposase [Anaerolineales bacterium]|jgi:transposase InsO family protein